MARTPEADARYRATMARKKAERAAKQQLPTLSGNTDTVIYREYYCFKDMQNKLFTNATAERWAKEMIEWAKLPTSLKVTDWFLDNDICHGDGMQLCEVYPVLKHAFQKAKMTIGNRRERGGLRNELNAGLIHSTMSLYDQEWKAKQEWEANLKKDIAKAGNVHVTIERYAPTDIVPEKQKLVEEQDADI